MTLNYTYAILVGMDERLLNRIDKLMARLNENRPLKRSVVEKLREQFLIEMTYNSNAIEGNKLSLKETYLVLREGITVKGKNLKDHLEAKNHQEALKYLFDLVDGKKRISISNSLIRELHQLVVKDTENRIAGEYRKTNVAILGSTHKPVPGFRVQEEMDKFVQWVPTGMTKLHPIEFAAKLHHRFVHIHPFEDGNGRTGRLLMNLFLMREGYPIAIILKSDRVKYYKALEKADKEDFESLIRLIAQAVERSLNVYIEAIESTGNEGEFVPLSKIESKTTYSAKYLNLLINKGLLAGKKEGRNWLTSMKAIKDYEVSRLRIRKPRKKIKKSKEKLR
jgi:Fic family protein